MHILHLNQRNQILFQYLRDKKKKKKKKERKGLRKKGGGGENSTISPPLDPRLTTISLSALLKTVLALLPILLLSYLTFQYSVVDIPLPAGSMDK